MLSPTDGPQRQSDVGHAADARRVAGRAHEDEIVVHDGMACEPEAVCNEFSLGRLVVD